MELLKLLEGNRTPILNVFFSFCSMLGEEVFFTLIIFGALWVAEKRTGFWMFFTWIFGSSICQLIKITVKAERPWERSADFKPYEGALKKADGFSFPSGHSQSVTGLFGSLALFLRKKWVWAVSAAAITLCAFSRMYLGVHFLADVIAGVAIGAATVALTALLARLERKISWISWVACAFLLLTTAASVIYAQASGLEAGAAENAWKLFGASAGLTLAWQLDRHVINFDTRAVWFAQILKCAVGGALTLLIMEGLKQPLLSLFNGHGAAHAVRFFLTASFAGAAWPATFRVWNMLGKKRRD